MFHFFRKKRIAELVWQYLDGVIPPDRFRFLEESLQRWSWARTQFIDCAVLNALLTAYYNPGTYKTLPTLGEMISPGRAPAPAYECVECNLDLDAELEQIEAELEAAERAKRDGDEGDRPKRKRPAV